MNSADAPSAPSDQPAAMPTPADVAGKPASSKFRLGTVLKIVLPVAALALAVVAAAGFLDIDAILSDLSRPALAPVTGQVIFQGQPLLKAQLLTKPAGGRGKAAVGWTDDEGKFTLKTDIRGVYVDGATVGEHRVTVTAYADGAGASAPPLLTPPQYASPASSPLTIKVARGPAKNEFRLVLEGEPPPRRPGRAGPAKQARPKSAGGDFGASKAAAGDSAASESADKQ
jgi:hypothetical protein